MTTKQRNPAFAHQHKEPKSKELTKSSVSPPRCYIECFLSIKMQLTYSRIIRISLQIFLARISQFLQFIRDNFSAWRMASNWLLQGILKSKMYFSTIFCLLCTREEELFASFFSIFLKTMSLFCTLLCYSDLIDQLWRLWQML